MGKKSPAPPPAPDYSAAAREQGQANLEAARLTARISNPNVYTPYGSQTVTFGKQTFDEAGYSKAMEAYNQQLADFNARKDAGVMTGGDTTGYDDFFGGYRGGNMPIGMYGGGYGTAPTAPTREQFTTTTDLDTPTITQTLNAEEQKILDAQRRVSLGLSGLGETALGVAERRLGTEFNPNLPNIQTQLTGYDQVARGPDLMGMGQAQGGYTGPAMPTLNTNFGQAVGNVGPGRINYGPTEGQYGMAQGGVAMPELQGFTPTGLPNLTGYDMSGLPRGGQLTTGGLPQIGGLDLSGLTPAQALSASGMQDFSNLDMSRLTPTQALSTAGLPALSGVNLAGLPQAQALTREGLTDFQGLNTGALPGLQSGVQQFGATARVNPLQQQTELNLAGVRGVNYDPNLGMFGLAQGFVPQEQLQRGFDLSNVAAMPVAAGTTGQQAILSRVMPQVQERRAALENQLINQGIPRGSEAYNTAIREQQQQENDLVQQAALQGLQLDMAARQQGFGEAQAQAEFANQAALGQFGLGTQSVQTALGAQAAQNAAQQQDFAQRVAAGQFGNEARQALFGAGLSQAQLQNQASQQNFTQGLAAAQFANQARGQAFGEQQAGADLAARQRAQQFGESQAMQQAAAQARAQGLTEQQAAAAAAAQQRGQQFSEQQAIANQAAQLRAQGLTEQQAQAAINAQQRGQQFNERQAIADQAARLRAQGLTEQQAQQAAASQVRSQLFGEQQAQQDQIARLRSQGLSEQQAQAQLALQQRNALFGEQQNVAQFANQTALQRQQAALANQQAYNQAIQQNLQQGLSIQQAQNAASQQLFGQQMSAAQLQNQALAQNRQAALDEYRALLGGQAQTFGQGMDTQAARNAALAQNQSIAAQQQQLQNAAQIQQFNQALQTGQFGNTALQQSFQQQLALRNQPINEISALMSGAQVNAPQFQGYQGANVAAAPVFGAAQATGDFAQRNYQNQVGAYNARMGLYGSLANTAGMFFSDRRLKSNIVRVGTHPRGIGVYEYDIFGQRQRGVMADEVKQVLPEAVVTHPSGYQMVNYGLL
jgi:hypothetical protein